MVLGTVKYSDNDRDIGPAWVNLHVLIWTISAQMGEVNNVVTTVRDTHPLSHRKFVITKPRCHEDKTAAHIPPPTEHALIVTKVSLSVEQTHTDHMAPSLRDVLMNELLGVIGLTVPVKPEDGNTYKLITRLFNPSTYRCSPDKAAHEMAHVKGSKRGGHFYWLLRKVRSLATDSDDPVIKSHTLDILEAFPVFDPLLEKQSVEFCNFDKGMTVKRNLLQLEGGRSTDF